MHKFTIVSKKFKIIAHISNTTVQWRTVHIVFVFVVIITSLRSCCSRVYNNVTLLLITSLNTGNVLYFNKVGIRLFRTCARTQNNLSSLDDPSRVTASGEQSRDHDSYYCHIFTCLYDKPRLWAPPFSRVYNEDTQLLSDVKNETLIQYCRHYEIFEKILNGQIVFDV